ncbi:putative cytochrome b5-like heme/steroid binding domain, cytochrome b5, heme-binding protein [Helianthus annuus]|uniref:Cytochrome b5-like heme/steroid binding domain-containing protein n=2 Tax=Helianthus annuus TaxID=4232 RepID=A0A9K3JA61_HELAN|nr:cytochrome b5 [Helianthus annuus]XP_022033393.1 cytochrome b5 [Helianthus annuus]XP_035844575.1 cytochrome b5 [Helianthus annuus]KAF5811470.1 putative cytochrome b5-like heme/steroid binding domain-containing protein [Helianthus annuus]KAJ0590273.1 putative cytochrome b5-like heme/steroid binding domain, cytochrome b5, heme-binding protein [Helianthus annuus]KAJ0928207.1 putative cytochrome b5-like heme/steroid binding domain, cytochrome b5, heme-binding protein [Helianthus annuus]
MTLDPKILSFEEVSKHNRKTDCWVIISGKVYDVTPFLDDHPGGDEILILATEKDATEDFEDVGHSQNAIDMMKDYYVGEVDSNTMPRKNTYNKPPSSTTSAAAQASGSSSTNILTFVLPILILVLAYALYYFANKKVAVSFTHL